MKTQKNRITPEEWRRIIQSSHPHLLRKYESIGEIIIAEKTSGRMPGMMEIEFKNGTYINCEFTEIKGRPKCWFGEKGNWNTINSIVGYYAGFHANGTYIGAPDEILLAQGVKYIRDGKGDSSEFYGIINVPMERIKSAKIIKK